MGTKLWTAPGSTVPLVFFGRIEFVDVSVPFAGKDEWGMDTLERSLRGPIYLLEEFLASLNQGDKFPSKEFYLQSWQPDKHPYAPTVSLLYKGLTSGIPDPLITSGQCDTTGTIQASNLSITVGGKVIVSASKEVQYRSPRASYRYISNGEPPPEGKYNTIRGGEVRIIDSRITATYSDGTTQVFIGVAPAALVTALTTAAVPFVTPSAARVFGTPYWECQDEVQLRFP